MRLSSLRVHWVRLMQPMSSKLQLSVLQSQDSSSTSGFISMMKWYLERQLRRCCFSSSETPFLSFVVVTSLVCSLSMCKMMRSKIGGRPQNWPVVDSLMRRGYLMRRGFANYFNKIPMPPKKKDTPPPQPAPFLPTSYSEFQDSLLSWKKPLAKFLEGRTFQKIHQFTEEEYKTKVIYPAKENIFKAFQLTPLEQVKVVIVGQDPYISPNQAHGLCFSVLKPQPPPPSLKNIYKNLGSDSTLHFKAPNHGDLTEWAKQGVFLLNATLTVQHGLSNSHAKCGWQDFTDQVIKVLNENCSGVVFLLWGANAQQKAKMVNRQKHHVLETSHPSPLSVRNGFSDSRQFSECNEILKKEGKTPIDWNLTPA